MIHFIRPGDAFKIGLNLHRAAWGFVAIWAWYDPGTHEMSARRFRLRLHMSPRLMWSSDRWHVVENYLRERDMDIVHREVLADLKTAENVAKRVNEPLAYIKPAR
jgi:hypothetical protein